MRPCFPDLPLEPSGRDDPWVVPIWGQRLKRLRPEATYLELAPAGHCPHHEAPTAINNIIQTWVAAVEAGLHTQHDLLQVRCGWCCAGLVMEWGHSRGLGPAQTGGWVLR
jgi:hypothetical protein